MKPDQNNSSFVKRIFVNKITYILLPLYSLLALLSYIGNVFFYCSLSTPTDTFGFCYVTLIFGVINIPILTLLVFVPLGSFLFDILPIITFGIWTFWTLKR